MPFDPPSSILNERRERDGTHVCMFTRNQKTKSSSLQNSCSLYFNKIGIWVHE